MLPNECQNCGSKKDLDIHHIVPLSICGTNKLSNLAMLCLVCHGAIHGLDRVNSKSLQKIGIKKAMDNGVKFGRPKIEISEEFMIIYNEWKSGFITAAEAMRELEIKPNTFYRRVKEIEKC